MKNGNWNGNQIVLEYWVKATAKRDTIQGKSTSYTNCFWLDTYPIENKFNKSDLFAGGYGGQIVYINPENSIVIIRTGTTEVDVHWGRSFSKLSYFPINHSPIIQLSKKYNFTGAYKSKSGKEIFIHEEAGNLVMKYKGENFEYHLAPTSDVTFEDKKYDRKVLLEFRNDFINGLIVEDGANSNYFSKQ